MALVERFGREYVGAARAVERRIGRSRVGIVRKAAAPAW
jgi:hypothetical protein